MIDVHSHLLPGVDDGSRSVEQSVEVLGRFAAAGVTDVILTPHIKASGILDYGEEMLTMSFDSSLRIGPRLSSSRK